MRNIGEIISSNRKKKKLSQPMLAELLQEEGYIFINGENIAREKSEVLLTDDLANKINGLDSALTWGSIV